MKKLLDVGADVDVENGRGAISLPAAFNDDFPVVKLLVQWLCSEPSHATNALPDRVLRNQDWETKLLLVADLSLDSLDNILWELGDQDGYAFV